MMAGGKMMFDSSNSLIRGPRSGLSVLARDARLACATVVAVLAASSVVACGTGESTFATVVVERAIAASILAQHQLRASVLCPARVPRRAGYVFICTASFAAGRYEVQARETDDRGHVSYGSRTPLKALDVARVERAIRASIRRQRRLAASVRCPGDVIRSAGVAFTCTAVVHGRRYPFSVSELAGDGRVRYVGLDTAGSASSR
jgi:hypothetical protein